MIWNFLTSFEEVNGFKSSYACVSNVPKTSNNPMCSGMKLYPCCTFITAKADISRTVDLWFSITWNCFRDKWINRQDKCTGGNGTIVAAATIVSMAAAKKAQQNVFALYHSYNRTILLGFFWILDFHFKIIPMLRRRYLIPIRCNTGKRKMWHWRWLHQFDFQHWWWLHALMTMVALFRAGNFSHTHSRSPAGKYAYRLYDCCQMWYV